MEWCRYKKEASQSPKEQVNWRRKEEKQSDWHEIETGENSAKFYKEAIAGNAEFGFI